MDTVDRNYPCLLHFYYRQYISVARKKVHAAPQPEMLQSEIFMGILPNNLNRKYAIVSRSEAHVRLLRAF